MTKIKGLFKGIRFISQIFVFKEHEMEIGNPTDVRHVAHIGYDSGSSMSSPSWMKEFKTSSDFSLTSLGNLGQSRETSWASQDFDPRARQQAPVEILSDQSCAEGPKVSKKMRRKKTKSSSPSSTSRSSTKFSKMRSSCAASIGGVNDGIPQEILVN